MTKRQLLLSLAIDAVNWGEGSDFEMKELIHDADRATFSAIKEHYSEFFRQYEYDDEKYEDKNGAYSRNFYHKVRSDVVMLLRELKSKE